MLWVPDAQVELSMRGIVALNFQSSRGDFVDPLGCVRVSYLHLVAVRFRVGFGED
jgi:hypothetical protein